MIRLRLILVIGAFVLGLIPTVAFARPSDDVPTPPPGTIYGTVTQSPCPGPESPRAACSLPVPSVDVVLIDRNGDAVATTRTDENGVYWISAPYGRYVMTVAEEVFLPDCPATRVLVSSFYVFRYDVACDSGARAPVPQDTPSSAETADADAFGR